MSDLEFITRLRRQLHGIGIVDIEEQDRVIHVARRCAKTGMLTGTGWMILGAPAMAPGAVAGFLSGFVTGTATCMSLSYAARDTIRQIGSGEAEVPGQ